MFPYPQSTQVLQATCISCKTNAGKSVNAHKPISTTTATGGVMAVLTLNVTDLIPLFLLHQSFLKFGAEGDLVGVVKHDANHLSR